jgi:CBS domain-containing protein
LSPRPVTDGLAREAPLLQADEPHSLDDALEKRQHCRAELVRQHMNTEHVDVGPDYSDAQVAETFLHHRVLVVPITDRGRVLGVITRSDFFSAVANRFLG